MVGSGLPLKDRGGGGHISQNSRSVNADSALSHAQSAGYDNPPMGGVAMEVRVWGVHPSAQIKNREPLG